jgi:PH domain
MTGWLVKSSVNMPGAAGGNGGDLLGMVVNGIGSGLMLGLKTIQLKQTKQYFALKNGTLYWYIHERAREALKSIDIKQTKAVDLSPENPKEFYVIAKKKCYRLLCEHEGEALKWVNSLKAVREGGFTAQDKEYLDENRYEKLKVYSRVTGKSMYKEYDVLL